MNWLKKPKFLAAAFVILLIVVVFMLKKPNDTNKDTLINQADINNPAKLAQKDSDNDSLMDWEESLIGTNPNNKDSDGDGTNDGVEVELGRNPLLAGPNDEVSLLSIADGQEIAGETPNFNKFSEDFLKGYIELKKQGKIGTDAEGTFVSELLEKNISSNRGKVYEAADVTLTIAPSKESVSAYASDLDSIFSQMYKITEYELLTFTRAVENSDSFELRKLREPAKIYKEIVENLLTTETPENVVDIHVELLNGFSFLASSIEKMIVVENDPLAALVAVDGYTKSEEELGVTFSRLNTYFLTKGGTQS
ncbi:MAG: hypothetical protein ISR99_00410 [Parcubacteria group bacterium]|nr:hypothetical protein [Parcubacteria group bacterium]